jgi:hypothetical protein
MSASIEYCVLSGKGLCLGLITRPEESYRLCVGVGVCVFVCVCVCVGGCGYVCVCTIMKPRQ